MLHFAAVIKGVKDLFNMIEKKNAYQACHFGGEKKIYDQRSIGQVYYLLTIDIVYI